MRDEIGELIVMQLDRIADALETYLEQDRPIEVVKIPSYPTPPAFETTVAPLRDLMSEI
jgi:hypothetical protein